MKLKLKIPRAIGKKNARQKGIAIITVLAVMLLMTLLVVGFFSMATNQVTRSQTYADGLKVRWMKDIAVNLVIAQIREATSAQAVEDDANKFWSWSSQPGAIRVFHSDLTFEEPEGVFTQGEIYKLYSSHRMTRSTVAEVEGDDVESNWAAKPDNWVDINAPAIDEEGNLHFPIADPRAEGVVEGFSFTNAVGGFTSESGEPLLPMPVQWLYVLKDGTLGYLSSGGSFVSSSGSGASADNPIAGRIAFWTDDESSKINVNTASEGVFWDVPRANSQEERALAKNQPIQGEFQRYPGHPATTSLSVVLTPELPDWDILNPNENLEQRLDLFAMAPVVTIDGHRPGSETGSRAGTQSTPITGARYDFGNTSLDKHLLTTVDELAFETDLATGIRELRDGLDIDRLAQGKFFLTAHSKAPEVTLFGHPRMAMWPMDESSGSRSVFDKTIAFCATVGGRPYYLQRRDSSSRHGEFYNRGGGRNKVLFDWIIQGHAQAKTIPGWGSTMSEKYLYDEFSELWQIGAELFDYIKLTNLFDPNTPGTMYAENSEQGQVAGICMCGGTGPHQSRWHNTVTPYPKGIGRIASISEIGIAFAISGEITEAPKPVGDPNNPTDWELKGDGNVPDKYNDRQNPWPKNYERPEKGDMRVETALIFELFAPSHGWSRLIPGMGFNVAAANARYSSSGYNSIQPAPSFKLDQNWKQDCNAPLPYTGGASSRTWTVNSPPNNWIAWGGYAGPRLLDHWIRWEDCVVRSKDLQFPGLDEFVIIVNDTRQSFGDVNQLVQAVHVSFEPFEMRLPDLPQEAAKGRVLMDHLATQARQDPKRLTDYFGASGNPRMFVRTVVPNHGDYRLTTAKRVILANTWVPFPDLQTYSTSKDTPAIHAFVEGIDSQLFDPGFEDFALPGLVGGRHNLPTVNYDPEAWPDFPVDPEADTYCQSLGRNTRSGRPIDPNRGVRPTASAPHPDPEYRYLKPEYFDPLLTGDWENGYGNAADGAYSNRADDGFWKGMGAGTVAPYFDNLTSPPIPTERNQHQWVYSPNKTIASPVMFGGQPTGVQDNVPWRTLLFRPQQDYPNKPRHFGKMILPDHLFLDYFWMPVVEPYSISEPFATSGKVNLNYQILPFTYIKRATGLHAVLKNERILAIPNSAADDYKSTGDPQEEGWRYPINIPETLTQFDSLFEAGGYFRTASEICEMWLVPEAPSGGAAATDDAMKEFWDSHLLTGDNSRERPYATIYPRVTTKSNVFKVHMVVQTLQPGRGSEPGTFDSEKDFVTGEYRGSAIVERKIQEDHPDIPDYATNWDTELVLDKFYSYRITDVKQFAP